MTSSDTPTAPAGSNGGTGTGAGGDDAAALLASLASDAAPAGGRRALSWVDEDAVAARSQRTDRAASAGPYSLAHADLLADRPRRSAARPGVVVPILSTSALVAAGYAAATLLWPLHALPPHVTTAVITAPVAAVSSPAWPQTGFAATAVDGLGTTASTTTEPQPIASITKLVTALLVLDRLPLAPGEQGPEFAFGPADAQTALEYLWDDQSWLDVPVGGVLTEYQMLQGVLIGSANNYADRLRAELWPTRGAYADAANAWLNANGVGGVEVVDSSGIARANTADPASLLSLARLAMAQPVIAEIVGQSSVELPGAGVVENTNALLSTPGVVGVKTGSLTGFFNLVVAQDATVAGQSVRAYAVVQGQPDDEARFAAGAALLAQTLAEVEASPALPAGTAVARVSTAWGATSDVVTGEDARVALWNGQVSEAQTALDLEDGDRSAGDGVGTLTLAGPLGSVTAELVLTEDLEGPDAWWRLSHPLHLWGLAG